MSFDVQYVCPLSSKILLDEVCSAAGVSYEDFKHDWLVGTESICKDTLVGFSRTTKAEIWIRLIPLKALVKEGCALEYHKKAFTSLSKSDKSTVTRSVNNFYVQLERSLTSIYAYIESLQSLVWKEAKGISIELESELQRVHNIIEQKEEDLLILLELLKAETCPSFCLTWAIRKFDLLEWFLKEYLSFMDEELTREVGETYERILQS